MEPMMPPLPGLIARMRAEGREKEIQKELKKLKNIKQTSIPKDAGVCIGGAV